MWVDISIAAALALVTIAMGYLGVHVTLHPADTALQKRWYKGGFVACAIAAVALVVCQGVRDGKAQIGFQNAFKDAASAARTASQSIDGLEQDEKADVAKRQQAEKDLAIIVNLLVNRRAGTLRMT